MTEELTPEKKKETMVANVTDNYIQVEKSIVNQLYMKHDLHGTTAGSEREIIWSQLFEMIIPKKFVIEASVFIIDSKGNVSKEVDFAILDETYTPYIFRYGKIKFVPIEAIAAVIECKSQKLDAIALEKWAESIKALKTSTGSIARLATSIAMEPVKTQKATRPIRILCALQENCSDNIKKHFDFTLLAMRDTEKKATVESDKNEASERERNERIKIESNTKKTLLSWFESLNFNNEPMLDTVLCPKTSKQLEDISLANYEVLDENGQNISLMTFNFQLNQLLMLINNPILFPHQAYAELFSRKGGQV
ncbi:hypothetical protein DET54_11462 [Paenibacillus pabuli]|uniref:DUF6602 domain-containing protein n=1 Tax=Paenibacillus pabuli TaxID=1472 RepID=A0ABX9BEX8_9BACL|nr:DUF6602 domain-containing protein [Paenibacillus pabuli]RAI89594.1 hypothetical protein DET54_11462 [Paenibacillus pabuli]